MDPTPDSLFESHLAGQAEGDFEDALAAEVAAFEALLEEHPQHAKELSRLRDAGKSESQGSSGPLIGDHRASEGVTIGDFKLVKKLGRGGMGEVWEAQQLSLSRRIALKLLPAAGSERAQEFFAREARAGGRLNHPGIVSVMGTGEDEGVRWISMELVEGGRTLRDLLEEMRSKDELSERYYPEIAELFAKIAEAMAVAHEAGVIHRDLKPANIMVTGEGEPKVADFGLARVLDEAGLSQSGEVMGTFYYMSPEQVKAVSGGVDHRADVFSLGALFYEALVMARPFEGDTTLQIVEKILNHDPPDPKALRSRVPEDLAVICTKALEKDREGRYASMTGLAADLRRHLADEPILAQPPSTWKRAMKWARRNPTKSVAGALSAAAFVAISALAWQLQEKTDEAVANAARAEENAEEAAENARQATANAEEAEDNARQAKANEEAAEESAQRAQKAEGEAVEAKGQAEANEIRALAHAKTAEEEHRKAEERTAELQQVSDFQAKQLSGVDPEAMGEMIRTGVFDQVRAAGERAGRDPRVVDEEQATLEGLLRGADFTGLGLGVLDEQVFERALQELETFENQPLVQARLLETVAGTLQALGLLVRAVEPQERAVEIFRRELGGEHAQTLESINSLGGVFLALSRLTEAETYFRESMGGCRKTLGDEHPKTLNAAHNLVGVLHNQGRVDEAEPLMHQTLAVMRRTLGSAHLSTLAAINLQGTVFESLGKLSEAESLYREALEGRRSALGEEHHNTLTSVNNLAMLLCRQGKHGEAEPLARKVLEVHRRVGGNDHPSTLTAVGTLGTLLRIQGKLDDAEPYLREALEGTRRTLGDDHRETLVWINNLGSLLQLRGMIAEAELLLREALQGSRRTLGEEHPNTLAASGNLCHLLQSQGKFIEAESLARAALEKRRRVLGDEHPDTLVSVTRLSVVLYSQGKLDEAEALAHELVEHTGKEHPKYDVRKQHLEKVREARRVDEDG